MSTVKELEDEIKNVDQEISKVDSEIAKWKNRQRELHEKKTSLKNSINQLKSEELNSIDWAGTIYEWSEKVNKILKGVFKIDSFRPKQLSAINSTLAGHHTIVVMPTGAGKSLCYQLPALVKPGITVVVSPLVSLMEDQVRSLTKKNIPAMLISSSSPNQDTTQALNALKDGKSKLKLIYATPERFAKSKRFMSNLQKCHADGRLQRIAIDEVHCCSQWGHDFRPDYKYLGILANMFPNVPILGLTATATAHVLSDVQKILNIPGCLLIKSTFNRPNLFSVNEECIFMLEKLLKGRYKNESGIIYTNSIKECEDINEGLRKRGLKVGCYHANLEASSRSKVHLKWHDKEYQAIVATVAFGMGIDKPDVRFVIHHTISKSMENYYQESGRAGRDGQYAECVTLYRMQDVFKVGTMVFSNVGSLEHLYGMVKYCLNGSSCRRMLIAEHFDETWGNADCNNMCDVCLNPNIKATELNVKAHCKTIATIIEGAEKQDVRLTAQKILDAWFLKGPVKLRHKGKEPNLSRTIAEDVIMFLIVGNYLVEDFHYTAYSTISYIKIGPNMFAMDDESFILTMPVRKYYCFNLESQPRHDYQPVESVKSEKDVVVKKQKRKSTVEVKEEQGDDESKSKKPKTVIISDDSD